MTIEIIGVWSAFQSEKTGSTPVGSAMISLKFLVCQPNVWHFSISVFGTPCSFAVLFELVNRCRGELPLISPLGVVRHHAASRVASDCLDLLFCGASFG
jgi:hypothetical protein